MADNETVETVYVAIEADLRDYFKQVTSAVNQTTRMFNEVSGGFRPFNWDVTVEGFKKMQTEGRKFKQTQQQVNQESEKHASIWQKISGGYGQAKSKIGDLVTGGGKLSGYLKQVSTQGAGAVQSILGFAQGKVAIGGVANALKGLVVATGPVGAAVGLAVGGIVLAVKGLVDKVGEATAGLRKMFDTKYLETFGSQTASQFEKFNVQFEVLLKSGAAARERIAEYAEFGAKTPFELPEIVQAGKVLQTFGGEALATGDTLKLIGDAASGAQAPFNELAMWVGRAYTSIQSGRPFGEAAARLQELAILSGTERQELEDMQKAGASTTEMWEKFTGVLSKFDGMMEMQSKTMEGMQSNLTDYEQQIALIGGTPIFDEQKRQLGEYLSFLEGTNAFQSVSDQFAMLKKSLEADDFTDFSEQIRSLEELGAITAAERRNLESMVEAGASAKDVLNQLGESEGLAAMNEQGEQVNKTLEDLQKNRLYNFEANLDDLVELGAISQEAADDLKAMKDEGASAKELLDQFGRITGLESNKDVIKDIAQGIGIIRASFLRFANEWKQKLLDNLPLDKFRELVEKISEIVSNLNVTRRVMGGLEWPEMIAAGIGKAIDLALWLADIFSSVTKTISQMSAMFQAFQAGVETYMSKVQEKLGKFSTGNMVADIAAFQLSASDEEKMAAREAAQNAMNESMLESADIMAQEEQARQRYLETLDEEADAHKDVATAMQEEDVAREAAMQAQLEKTQEYADEFLDMQEQMAEERQAIEQRNADAIAQIEAGLAEKQEKAALDRQQALDNLVEESAADRIEAVEDAEKARQEAAGQADEAVAKKQAEFQEEERRQLEDHQDEMDRMRRQYLDSLTDAVKNRDARAIVDLRRGYQQQRTEAESSFGKQQERQRQDNDQAIAEIQTNKAREIEAINQAEAEKLAAITVAEDQKRVAIEAKFQEQMAQAQAQAVQAQAQQEERYNAEIAQQNEAMQRKLEALAESMAKDKEVTEEGARQILEALNETFGIGGDIDKLMEDFASRRKTKMDVQITVEKFFKGQDLQAEAQSSTQQAAADRYTGLAGTYGKTPTGTGQRPLTSREEAAAADREFASGGLMLATRPTLVSVAEKEPELFSAAPVRSLASMRQTTGGNDNKKVEIEFKGTAPPGIGRGEVDQVAGVLVSAFREAGWFVDTKRGG